SGGGFARRQLRPRRRSHGANPRARFDAGPSFARARAILRAPAKPVLAVPRRDLRCRSRTRLPRSVTPPDRSRYRLVGRARRMRTHRQPRHRDPRRERETERHRGTRRAPPGTAHDRVQRRESPTGVSTACRTRYRRGTPRAVATSLVAVDEPGERLDAAREEACAVAGVA